MSYRLAQRGIVRIADGAVIKPGSPDWAVYIAWLRAGGQLEAAYVPSRFSSIEAARADVRARIDLERTRQEAAGFTYAARRYQSDPASRTRILLALSLALNAAVAGPPDWAITWRTATNTLVSLTGAEMIALGAAMYTRDAACLARALALKAAADAAAMPALLAFDVSTGWPA